MVAYWERVLNGLVVELYFPEEVQGAIMRDERGRMKGGMFDLVAQAALPVLPHAETQSREEEKETSGVCSSPSVGVFA
jgi:hypothetical protein